jgi:hypothetical protein
LGSADITALQIEVAWAQEAIAVAEAARAMAMLAAETSAREDAMARDTAILHINGAEDRAALAEWEALVMRGWFPIFREVEVGQLVEIMTLVKKALNRRL